MNNLENDKTQLESQTQDQSLSPKQKKTAKKKKKSKEIILPSKGIETLFRSSYRMLLDLTSLADGKANIMLSINSLSFTIVAVAGSFIVNSEPLLLLPISVFLISSLGAMIFAVLATKPRVPQTKTSKEELITGDAELLYFKNFTELSQEEYVSATENLMKSPKKIYEQMSKSIYGLGVGLTKKFNLLEISFSIFIYGLFITIILFLGVFGFIVLGQKDANAETKDWNNFSEIYEPSAITQLKDGRFLVIEDEKEHSLNIVSLNTNQRFSSQSIESENLPFKEMRRLDDLEGLDIDKNGFIFAITSHSRSGKGKVKRNREKFLRFNFNENQIENASVVLDLKKHLIQNQNILIEAAEIEDVKNDGGLNIEGLAFDAKKEKLLVGYRSPLSNSKAIISTIENPTEIFTLGEQPKISPKLQLLDLQGEGIRGMNFDQKLGGFLIISGPVAKLKVPFKLWFWNQKDAPKPVKIRNLKSLEHSEGITSAKIDGKEFLVIVSDDGDSKDKKGGSYLIVNYEDLIIE
ncbi:MAG: DUF3616 domain-containing protein [Calditrichaeota bacterium]|nr:MAG: DUF3616 domain-containing protein [Calditrichota bacterium]